MEGGRLILAVLCCLCIAVGAKKILTNGPDCTKARDRPVQCSWRYLAYMPRIFRAGVEEKVLISTQNVDFDVTVEAKLVNTRSDGAVIASGRTVVKPGVLTEILLKVPADAPSRGIVQIKGDGNVPAGTNGLKEDAIWIFKNKTNSINIDKASTSIFIQTDRPIYKPGESMRMRVIAIDSQLKPVNGEISIFSVLNPSRSLMRQWRQVKLYNGVASFKLKLSIKPVLGSWEFQAIVNGISKTVKVKVEKYVLPKFQVKMNPPPFIALGQTDVYAEVCAKYSYGKNVAGWVEATICGKLPGYYDRGWQKSKTRCTITYKRIFGCEQIKFNLNTFKVYQYTGWGSIDFTFKASVKETATGITYNATDAKMVVVNTDVALTFDGTPAIFKPGLPFEAVIRASHPDNSPVKDVKVNVKVTAGWSNVLFLRSVIVKNGRATINLPEIPFNAKEVRFRASYTREKVAGSLIRDYKRETSAYLTSKAWYSPSHSYISIDQPKEIFKVGSDATLKVRYTSVDEKPVMRNVYYTLMCKGYAVHSGSTKTEFVAASSRGRRSIVVEPPTTEPVTAEPTAKTVELEETTAEPFVTTTAPELTTDGPYGPWWMVERVTRPPVPNAFSNGSFDISFKVTQEMSPSCRMLVYYVRNEETVADSTVVDVSDSFANKVSMKFSEEEVLPGTKVQLTLKASPGSVFAVSAVDKSVHFLANANDVKTSQVMGIIKKLDIGPGSISDRNRCSGDRYYWWHYSQSDYVDSETAFNDNGVTFLTNLVVDSRPCTKQPMPIAFMSISGDSGGNLGRSTGGPEPVADRNVKKSKTAKPKVRTEFPETWLWTDERIDSKTGEKVIDVKVPDTITTWYASGFAISGTDGLGVANPAEIRGFKAVFVSVNLPYAVVRGELVTIPVVAFNYLSQCLNVRISIKPSKDFQLITRNHANTCICGGRTATVMFKLYARTLGRIALEATAESQPKNICPRTVSFDSSNYIDIVRKKLLVEPEGIEKEYTFNSLVCPKENSSVQEKVKLSIPDKVVQGSVFSELRVIGDLMGPSLNNIDNLLKMPYGCGEQNMLNFAPNIFIMQYLKATGQLTSEIEEKAVGFTLQGYQRQLSYKHTDGAYSAFGESDKEGSMWLTAFVLKSFAQAREFIDIDKKVLNDAKKWILSKQDDEGCFPTIGTLHSKSMKGGVKTPVTLTGYVVVALLEAGLLPEGLNIVMGIGCIKSKLTEVNDTYSLNILAYTMAKAGRKKELTYILNKLDTLARKDGDTRYWGKPKKEPEEKKDDWFYTPYYQAKSDDIEQTAYGLMARINEGTVSNAVKNVDIIRWLSSQRNSLGGWASTQDTVLAMQALAVFASLVHGGEVDLTVDAAVPGFSHRFAVNNKNSLVLQRMEIPPKFPAALKTFTKGKGCALLSASVKYNVKKVQEVPAFKLSVRLNPLTGLEKPKYGRCLSQEIDICAEWLKDDTSNMAIISVKMLSGFEADTESLQKAVSRDPLLKEFEKKGKEFVFYYSRIGKKGVCLKFRMKQTRIVENIKPSSVKVYDYYDTGMSATKIYEVTPEKCVGIPTPDI